MIQKILFKFTYLIFKISLFFRPKFWKQVKKDVKEYKKTLKEIDEFLDEKFKDTKN